MGDAGRKRSASRRLGGLIPSLGDKQTICSQQKTGGTGVSPVCGSTLPLAMPSAQTGGTPVPPGRSKVQLFPGVGLIHDSRKAQGVFWESLPSSTIREAVVSAENRSLSLVAQRQRGLEFQLHRQGAVWRQGHLLGSLQNSGQSTESERSDEELFVNVIEVVPFPRSAGETTSPSFGHKTGATPDPRTSTTDF